MNRKTALLLFSLFFINHISNAQYNAFRIDALGALISDTRVFRPTYERSIGENFSASMTFEIGRYIYGNGINSTTLSHKINGWGLMPQFRWYPIQKSKPAPFGFFIGSHFRYRKIEEHYVAVTYDVKTQGYLLDFGGHAGYKFNLDPFNIELLFGLGAANGKFKTPNNRENIPPFFRDDLSGLEHAMRFEISLGFHFPKLNRQESTN